MNSFALFLILALQWVPFTPGIDTHASLTPSADFILDVPEGNLSRLNQVLGKQTYQLERIGGYGTEYRLSMSPEGLPTLDQLKAQGTINGWQYDRAVTPRNIPNDPLYAEQWDLMRIGMEDVWDQNTGGVTANGDTIVIAILDVGYEVDHEDLKPNLWYNKAEVPGDLIDNDQNGYVDDYIGVNLDTGDDMHEVNYHGTQVAGIIGAKGNNNRGVTGINWNVKLLLISGIKKESDIIEGYKYVKQLRDKYNQSGGTQGAFIVATNLSAGIDNAQAADHPMWCAQYDQLGASGILGVCSTTNTDTDVDAFGDMPTTCTSPYMVSVTNTGKDDKKMMFAGYGKTSIDLGAPGTPSLTAFPDNGYEEFIGTSASAPHVTGSVGMLYAIACEETAALAFTDPGDLALQMKNLLLTNVDQIPSLMPLTVTGGRLNLASAALALNAICGDTSSVLQILTIAPNPVPESAIAAFTLPSVKPYEVLIYDVAGRLVRKEKPLISVPGVQTFTLDVRSFPPGVYHFTVRQDGEQVTKSFMVP